VTTDGEATLEDLLRELAPQVLGTLFRRHGDFASCEDAVQEALLAASQQWPADGRPDNPRGWLLTVAQRRLLDQIRSDVARRRRESEFAVEPEAVEPEPDLAPGADQDDSLALLFLCCHPALTPPSRIALTLRAVGGLTTAQIAAAFLVPEATMAQRISRAKRGVDAAGRTFTMPEGPERAERLAAVLHVLYLIFNEGYTASSGADLTAPDLTDEAMRLTRKLVALLPGDSEAAGLLALMLLTDARRPARADANGDLVLLADQDRSLWNRERIAEGVELVSEALATGEPGPYQLQAAIAAVHDEAEDVAVTDWPQILALYDLLQAVAPNPMTALNRAVAVAMVQGPEAGMAAVAEVGSDKRMARHHRLLAVRAHLRQLTGDLEGAAADYREAAKRTDSSPEQRYLNSLVGDVENLKAAPTSSRKDTAEHA
jgi:RNA polymerase sigma factor (sigma-70 family)